MSRRSYSLALRLLLPGALLWFLWRNGRDRAGVADLLALGSRHRADQPLWLHAASVGEVQALAPVIQGLSRENLPLLLTVRTPAGLAHARRLYADLPLTVQFAPWDLPGACERFVVGFKPRAAVFVETELWPNLIAACRSAGVPLLLASARLSVRSLQRYQRWASRLMADTVQAFSAIAAQGEADRQRFIALGADPGRVTAGGNLKFDLPLSDEIVAAGARLRAVWAPDRPVWVAGSTHPGEEATCVQAQQALLAAAHATGKARPLLVLAPRRPERFAEVADWLAASGLMVARASQGAAATQGELLGVDVLLLDRMGDLLQWYAAGDVAFVGGSLVPAGGHNLLEPAALAKPVIAGPHCFSSPEVAALLDAADALIRVADAAELAQALERLLGDSSQARSCGERAAAVVAANRGTAQRLLAAIAALRSGATAPARRG